MKIFAAAFLIIGASWLAPLRAQTNSIAPEWDIGKTFAAIAADADRIAPYLDQIQPQQWLAKGAPVVLEFHNDSVMMGFSAPELGLRTDIPPGKITRLRLVPDKTGTFEFFCDIFCGSGHEEMTGTIIVA